MKNIPSTGFLILTITVLISCKKETYQNYNTSSITVVNAVEDASNMVVNFSDTALPFYLNQAPIPYASSTEYGISSGTIPMVVVSSADTVQALLSASYNVMPGGIYSLYLAGSGIPETPIDAVFLKDTIPVYADSLSGVRVINLSPGSNPVSINLQGNNASQMEFPVLAYKQITAFKSYPDTNGIISYTFEIRDQGTGNLLATFSWTFTVGKNNTLVINGSDTPNSATPINVFQVNNF